MAEEIIELKRNLSHILASATDEGPELTIGDTILKFKPRVTFGAYTRLQAGLNDEESDKFQVMVKYVKQLLASDPDEFEALLDEIDVSGVGEIVGAISEIYAGFQQKS